MYRIAVENGVRCAVQDLNRSARKAIVFVHGWPLSQEIFEPQFSALPQYGIRCVGVDLRGFGQSDRPARGYGYDRMADDLHQILCKLDATSVTLCGFSMGGAICVRYLARHRNNKVNKLILMGAACPSFVQRPGYPYGMTVPQVDSLIADAYRNRPQLCETFGRMCFYQNPGDAYLRWFSGLGFDASMWGTIRCAETLRDEDLRGDLKYVRVPTVIFHGRFDQVCPFPFAEEMQRGIANSILIPFERSGHCLFYEERDACNSRMVEFMR